MMHNLNRFSFQYENLINLLESGFEHLVTANLRDTLTRRVQREINMMRNAAAEAVNQISDDEEEGEDGGVEQ